jgi:hypothetical protein
MVRGNCTLEECVKSIRFRRSYASVKECLNDIGRKEWLMIRDFIFTASNTRRRVFEKTQNESRVHRKWTLSVSETG